MWFWSTTSYHGNWPSHIYVRILYMTFSIVGDLLRLARVGGAGRGARGAKENGLHAQALSTTSIPLVDSLPATAPVCALVRSRLFVLVFNIHET